MADQVNVLDNSGNMTGPHPDISDPVLGSAQKVTAGSKDTNATITVEQGKMYAITSIDGSHVFGIATTATAANCVWAVGEGRTIVIRVPIGYTTLHYQTSDDNRVFYIRKLAE